MNKYLFISIFALLLLLGYTFNLISYLSAENKRKTANFEQITKEHERKLALNKKEYESINAEWKDKLDSIREEYNIKLRHVKSATVTKVVYRDTTIKEVVYRDPVKIDSVTYNIPVNQVSDCWGMSGNIISKDKESKLIITDRTANNSIQILVTEKRRWIFWKHQTFEAYSDCGEIDVTRVDFTK